MNSLPLLITGVVVFALGYRFYSKLLALWVFRLDVNYSTPTHSQADDREFGARNRHLVLGHHFAIIAGATTLTGVAIAVAWGWIPAFLWVLVGTAVAAGVYGLGTLWLAVRHANVGLTGLVGSLINPRAEPLFLLLAITLLLIMNAVFAWLTAKTLASFPSSVLPFWIHILLALGLGVFLRRRGYVGLVPATLVTVIIALIVIWLFYDLPFAFSGALNIDVRGYSLVSVDATFIWVTLVFVSTYYSTRAPIWKLMQPRGYLTALLTAIFMLILITGVIITNPPVVAPEFNTTLEGPRVIPWLFVTLTSGAIAGFYLLFAGGITANQLDRETDARYVGYGAALIEGALALSVILVCTAGFSSQERWMEFYASWQGVQNLPQALQLYINGFVKFAAALGIAQDPARAFAAVVTAGLIAVTLDAGIRVQKRLLAELGERYRISPLRDEKTLLFVTVGLGMAVALYDGHGEGGLPLWPLFGAWNQVLAVVGLLMVGLALRRRQQPFIYLLAPMLFVLVMTTWALLSQLLLWWSSGDWPLLAGGTVLLLLEGWFAWEVLNALRQPLPALPDA